MPLDVLSQIQGFENGGQVAKNIGAIADSHPELQQAFQGAASALTNNGMNIDTENLAKVEQVMNSIVKATENSSSAMYGFGNTVKSIDVKPLHEVKATMDEISTSASGVEMSVGTSRASASLSDVLKKINEIKSNASANLKITSSVSPGSARGGVVRQQRFEHGGTVRQNFAKGGKVTYHKQNTETARTGGIFRQGSSTGDRNMIFANKGEGIITEKAMKQGAKQRGMSPESYIQALNHPSTNLRKIKKGRSFEYGGTIISAPGYGASSDHQKLWDYLKSDKFHGNDKDSTTSKTLSELLEDYVGTIFDASKSRDYLNEAQRLESQYQQEIRKRISNARKIGRTGKDSSGADTDIELTDSFGVTSTTTHGKASNAVATSFNTKVNQPTGGISGSGTGRNAIKSFNKEDREKAFNAIKQITSAVSDKYSDLDDVQKSGMKGISIKDLSDKFSNVEKLFKEGTVDQIDAFLTVVGDMGIDIDKIIGTSGKIADAVKDDAKDIEENMLAFGNAMDKMASSMDKDTIKKFQEEALNGLKAEIDTGLRDRSLKGYTMSVTPQAMSDTTKNRINDTAISDEEKKVLKKFGATLNRAKKDRMTESVLEGMIQKGSVKDKSGHALNKTGEVQSAIETGDIDISSLEALIDGIDEMRDVIEEAEDRVATLHDAFDKVFEGNERNIKSELTSIPLIGKAFDGNVVGVMAYAAALAYTMKQLVDGAKKLAEFAVKQAELNKGIAQLKSATNGLFADSNVEKFKESMNLTREQVAGLSEAFRKAGFSGETSFENIETIAQNIKDQFGQLDTSMLQEAVSLINDLPKKQIDVLVNGKGTMDDEASLIANLMNSGKLDMAAELISKGAFGEVEGLTPQMSEADRRNLEVQAEIKKAIDDIQGILNEQLGFLGPISQYVSGVVALAGPIAAGLGKIVVGMSSMRAIRSAVSGNAVNTRDVSKIGGGLEGKLGGKVGKVANVAAIGVSIATMVAEALSVYYSKQAQSNRIAQQDATNRSIKENKEKYGIGVSTAGIERGKLARQQQNKSDAWGTVAGFTAAGALLGSILPVFGTAVGAAVGGAIGLVAGGIKALIDYNSEEAEDIRKNGKIYEKSSQLQKTGIALQKRLNMLEEQGNKINKKDMQRGIVELSKIQKVAGKIVSGAMTAQHEQSKRAYKTNMEQISRIGGSGADLRANAMGIAKETSVSVTKDLGEMMKLQQDILNNRKLTSTEQQMAIAKNQEDMAKVFDRFIDGLESAAIKYDKIPEVIIASLTAGLSGMMMERKNRNMVGSSAENLSIGLDAIKAQQDAIRETVQASKSTDKNQQEIIDSLTKTLESHKIDMASAEKDFVNSVNVPGVRESNGSSQIQNDNLEVANKIMKEYEEELHRIYEKSGQSLFKQEVDDFNKASDEFGKFQKEVDGQNNKDWSKEKVDSKKKDLQSDIANYRKVIETQMTALADRHETNSEGYKQLSALLNVIDNDVAKGLKNADKVTDLSAISDMLAQAIANASLAMQADVVGKEKNNPEVQALNGKKAQYEAANNLKTVAMAAKVASNSLVAQKNAQTKSVQDFMENLDKMGDNMNKIIANLLNSSKLVFANAMKQNAEKGMGYEALTKGGVAAGANVTRFEASAVTASFENVRNARTAMEELQRKFDEIPKQLAEGMPEDINNGSNEAKEYLRLQYNAAKMMQKALLNPNDERAGKDAEDAQSAVDAFYIKQKDAIDKYAKEHKVQYDKMTGSINSYSKSVTDYADAIADSKKKFMEFFDGISKRVEDFVKQDYEFMSGSASVKLASSRYEEARANASISGMTRSGGNLVDRTAEFAKKEYELTKAAWKQQLAIVDEEFKKGKIKEDEYYKRRAVLVKEAEEDLTKKRVEKAKEVGESIEKMTEGIREKIGRVGEGLEIQKDLFETIGAPFEYILDIEKQMVDVAKRKAQAEEDALEKMAEQRKEGLITEEDYEKQKLKVARANAEVIKAAYGAQRNAIDKLLGSMMGTFQQIGGVFGPDSDFAKARKYGQGYTVQANGLTLASEGNVSSYAERVAGLSATATAGSPVPKMNRGDMEFSVAGTLSDMVGGGGKKKKKKGGRSRSASVKNEDTSDVKKGGGEGSAEVKGVGTKEKNANVPNDTEGLLKLILRDTNEIVRLLKEGVVVGTSASKPAVESKETEKPSKSVNNTPTKAEGDKKSGATPKQDRGNKPSVSSKASEKKSTTTPVQEQNKASGESVKKKAKTGNASARVKKTSEESKSPEQERMAQLRRESKEHGQKIDDLNFKKEHGLTKGEFAELEQLKREREEHKNDYNEFSGNIKLEKINNSKMRSSLTNKQRQLKIYKDPKIQQRLKKEIALLQGRLKESDEKIGSEDEIRSQIAGDSLKRRERISHLERKQGENRGRLHFTEHHALTVALSKKSDADKEIEDLKKNQSATPKENVKNSEEQGTVDQNKQVDQKTRDNLEKNIQTSQKEYDEKQKAFEEAEQAEAKNNKKIEELTNNRDMYRAIKKKEAHGETLTEAEQKFKEEHSGSNAMESDEQANEQALKEAKAKRSELRKNKMSAHKEAQKAKKQLDRSYSTYQEQTGDRYVSKEEAVNSEKKYVASVALQDEENKKNISKIDDKIEEKDKQINALRKEAELIEPHREQSSQQYTEKEGIWVRENNKLLKLQKSHETNKNSIKSEYENSKSSVTRFDQEIKKLEEEREQRIKKAKENHKNNKGRAKEFPAYAYTKDIDDKLKLYQNQRDKQATKMQSAKDKLDKLDKSNEIEQQKSIVKKAETEKNTALKLKLDDRSEWEQLQKKLGQANDDKSKLENLKKAHQDSIKANAELNEMEHYDSLTDTQKVQLIKSGTNVDKINKYQNMSADEKEKIRNNAKGKYNELNSLSKKTNQSSTSQSQGTSQSPQGTSQSLQGTQNIVGVPVQKKLTREEKQEVKKLKEISRKIKAQKKSERARANAEKTLTAEAEAREKEGSDTNLSDVKDEVITANQTLSSLDATVKAIAEKWGVNVKEPERAPQSPTTGENGQPGTNQEVATLQPNGPQASVANPAPNNQNPPASANGTAGGGTGTGGAETNEVITKTIKIKLEIEPDGNFKSPVIEWIEEKITEELRGLKVMKPSAPRAPAPRRRHS